MDISKTYPVHMEKVPTPPPHLRGFDGLHWLEPYSYEGSSQGLVALKWQALSKSWCRSGDDGQYGQVNAAGFAYIAPCPAPTLASRETARTKLMEVCA